MPRLTKTQSAALDLVRSRIDAEHPLHAASEAISAALMAPDVRRYLEAWVLPLLRYAAEGPSYFGEERDILHDHSTMRARRDAKDRFREIRDAAERR